MMKSDPIPARLAALKSMSVTQLKSEWQTICKRFLARTFPILT
jgi:hypothetical protein